MNLKPKSLTTDLHVRMDEESAKALRSLQSIYRARGLVSSKSDITRYALIEMARWHEAPKT